ncbi:cornifelin homolog A-like isoform X2 [Antennarius striatus]|uniref:cornifelin homolog A-like isoform X2 n=1 Tax=Antennarius striatus TaxID=241820 RepID=UPI0035AEF22C
MLQVERCLGCWCLPCFACKVTHDLGHCLCLPLLDIFSCPRPIATSMRVFVRHQYDIRGSLWEDCLLSTCCLACVWCQIAREMKTRQLPVMLSDIIRR